MNSFDSIIWLSIVLIRCGDAHENPGPAPSIASNSSSDSASSLSSGSFDLSEHISNNLSFVHYTVQSFVPKIQQLYADLCSFDVLAFTETWLNDHTSSSDIAFSNYQTPFRKDRQTDRHGGVLVYVRDTISARRRQDLEVNDIECIWLELKVKHKHILFGVFYRPPNSNAAVLSCIQDSLALAVDTRIKDIVVTGDFNLDYLKSASRSKIDNMCMQFGISQLISEPTHYTESSQSIIDLFFVSSPNLVSICGVGEPFLGQNIRYHCPVFCCIRYPKPRHTPFKRIVWKFSEANFDQLRTNVSNFDWNSCYNDDIDVYSSSLTSFLCVTGVFQTK